MKIAVPTNSALRLKPRDNKSLKVLNYDIDNGYPERVINIFNASGTGMACAELFEKFLRGRGFDDANVEGLVVNDNGQTLGDIHGLVCADRSIFEGFVLHIGYNALFEIVSIQHIPFEHVRFELPEIEGNIPSRVCIHPDWFRQSGRPFKPSDIRRVDLYTEDIEKIGQQIEAAGGFDKWNGHILYVSSKGFSCYPPAVADSVLEDVITDAGLKVWKNRAVLTGFAAGHILFYPGEFKDDDERASFAAAVNEYQGADNAFKIMVAEVPPGSEKPELTPVETIGGEKPLFETVEEAVRENIIRRYQQPMALHSIKTPGQLGMSREYEEAKKNYDERTEDDRNEVAQWFDDLLNNWHTGKPGDARVLSITGMTSGAKKTITEIGGLEMVDKIMSVVNSSLSPEQKLSILTTSFPIDPETAAKYVQQGKAAMVQTLGVGGTQALQGVLIDTTLTNEQKKAILNVVFGLTPEDANNVINGVQ